MAVRLLKNPKQFIGYLTSPIREIYHIYKKLFFSLQQSQLLSEICEKSSRKSDTKIQNRLKS